jgi:replicative DNA helicase
MSRRGVEAEQAVLGGVMLRQEAYWRVAEMLTADDFSLPVHALIWRAMGDAMRGSKPVDAVTLGEWFEAEGKSHHVQGGAYLVELASTTPSAANIVAYAEIVAKASERRRVQDAGKQIARAEDYAEAQALLAAARPEQAQRVKSARDGLAEMLDAMQLRANGPYGLSWGVPGLDPVAGRLVGSRLYGLAGRAKMGKTTLSLQPQLAAVLSGKRVLNYSLEMTAGELTQRALCCIGQFSHEIFEREDGVPDEAWSFIHVAASRLRDAPWLIDDQPGLTLEQITSRSRQHHMERELSLIVVDHLGLIALPKRGSRNDELGEVTYTLKNLSKELNVPVLALLQLNRNLEQRTDKRPIVSDVRDSGNIEQDMDSIVGIYRDEVYHPESADAGHAELISLANRHGRGGTAFVSADMEHMTYGEPKHPRREFPSSGSSRAGSSGGGFSNYGQARSQPRAVSGAGVPI